MLPGADLDRAASAGAFGSFLHQGQICMAAGRHLVHESLYDAYVEALAAKADPLRVGDPFRGTVALGPIIDERQLEPIDGDRAGHGPPGPRWPPAVRHDGPFYRPTVLTGLGRDMPAWQEEIFGPVAPVMAFSTLEEAVELANDSEYGLSVGILGDVGDGDAVADRWSPARCTSTSRPSPTRPTRPFGGMKSLRQRLAHRRRRGQPGVLHGDPVAHPAARRSRSTRSEGAQVSERPMPWAATWSAATRRGRSRLRLGTTMPSAATTSCAALDRHRHRAGAQAHLLHGGGVAVAPHPRELAAQLARLGDGVRRDPGQAASTAACTSAGAWASSTLPTPVACSGSREPTG